jgi:hypothetical protein
MHFFITPDFNEFICKKPKAKIVKFKYRMKLEKVYDVVILKINRNSNNQVSENIQVFLKKVIYFSLLIIKSQIMKIVFQLLVLKI